MGVANAQRTLDIIRTLTEFISQDQYKNVVPMFSILNEPYAATIGVDTLRHLWVGAGLERPAKFTDLLLRVEQLRRGL